MTRSLAVVFVAAAAALALVATASPAAAARNPAPPETQLDALARERAPGATRAKASVESDKGEADWHIDLVSGECAWVVGVGDPDIKAIAFYLWDPANKKVAVQKPGTAQGVLAHCPEVSGSYLLRIKTDEGGRYRWGLYTKSASAKAADDPLAAAVGKMARELAPDSKQQGDYFIGVTKEGDFSVVLAQGRCYWIVGVAEKRAHELDMFLWDPANKKVAAVKNHQPQNVINHCPTTSGTFRVKARPGSEGEYRLGVFVK